MVYNGLRAAGVVVRLLYVTPVSRHSYALTHGVAVKVSAQLCVDVAVFQHLVPFKGTDATPPLVSPVLPKVTVPAAAAVRAIVCMFGLAPIDMVSDLATVGAAGLVVIDPVKVPEQTILAAGQGTVDDVQANTVMFSGHKVPAPSCRISRWS